jgi:hypothetical protein
MILADYGYPVYTIRFSCCKRITNYLNYSNLFWDRVCDRAYLQEAIIETRRMYYIWYLY